MGDTLTMLWGDDQAARAEQASTLPYASISVNIRGNRGLVVMAYQSNSPDEHTFWQARDEATLEFRNGRPFATAGLDADLLGYRLIADETHTSIIEAHWQDGEGHGHRTHGYRTLSCSPPSPVELPLTTLMLERCSEHVEWARGVTSDNILWRQPESGRIWAGDVQPWPGAEPIRWQVARPWWSS